MFPIRPFPVAVASLVLSGCVCREVGRRPTAEVLYELSLEELLEIPVETVRSVDRVPSTPLSVALVRARSVDGQGRRRSP